MRKTPPHCVFDSCKKKAKVEDESTSAKNSMTLSDDTGL